MRTAVIADIHANLEALRSVLDRIHGLRVDDIVCLGDIVGYNANPNECVDIIRSGKITCIMGNHDASASGIEEPEAFNSLAREALLWTRETLTEINRLFLMNLPREQQVRDFFIFHGSVHNTDRYIRSRNDAIDNFRLLAGLHGALRIGFFGHTHIRTACVKYHGMVSVEESSELSLSKDKQYLINPGSVGQPRDGDPRAAFLVHDSIESTVVFYRVEYDIINCQDKIIRAGLPPRLAERLDWGE